MSLLRAEKSSNAAPAGGDNQGGVGDSLGERGYTEMPYQTKNLPARSYDDISGLKDSVGSLGNDGTSVETYHIQPDEVDPKTGPEFSKD